jgi:hypothetical protein
MATAFHSVVTERRVDTAATRAVDRTANRRKLRIALLTSALLVIGAPTAFAAMAVLDTSNLAQAIETVKTLGKQLSELKSILSTSKDIFGAIGQAKQTVNAVIPSSYSNVGTQVSSATPQFDSWGLAKDVQPNISSVNQAMAFLQKSLDLPAPEKGKEPRPVTPKVQADILQRRDAARREVTMRALAAAQNALATAKDASTTANGIISSNNTDLREQAAQQIQATVGVTQELIQIRVIMATLLELEAADKLVRIPVTTGFSKAPTEASGKAADSLDNPFNQQPQ